MKVYYDKKSKDPIYYIQKGIRLGKKATTVNVARIGRHSELLKITDDPLQYAKEQADKLTKEEKSNKKISVEIAIDYNEKVKATDDIASSSTSLNIGYFFLQNIYRQLDIKAFFDTVTSDRKIEFDPDLINRFMTYSRIMFPSSKLELSRTLGRYFENPEFEYQHIIRTMDIMEKNYDAYLEYLFKRSKKIVKRDTSVCYYDCTNYYFEIESPDYDYVDPVTGEFIKGFRKYGISKQHQPKPLVGMGLFMDADGIPISMDVYPGNENEQSVAIDHESTLLRILKGKKFVYCADAGLGSVKIRNFNSMGGRAFIVTQSVKKMTDVLKFSVFEDCDYRYLSSDEPASLEYMQDFDTNDPGNYGVYNDKIYRVVDASGPIDIGLYEEKVCKNGKVRRVKVKPHLKQKVIITFSRKTREYQRFVRRAQIERAISILEYQNADNYRKGPNDVNRLIKRKGEAKKRKNQKVGDLYELDLDRIREEEKYDGFYAIATNLDDTPQEILRVAAQRYKIEECFRITKTEFCGRPVFHRTMERITAHFMVCFTALLVYRLLEKKLDGSGKHYTIEDVIETLRNMQVAPVSKIGFVSTYGGSEICSALNALFSMGLDKKCYLPSELSKQAKLKS